jgi:hypothetical protein
METMKKEHERLYEIVKGMSAEDIQGITKYALFLKKRSDKMLSFIGRKVCGKTITRGTKTGVILDVMRENETFLVITEEGVLEYVLFGGAKILSDTKETG